MQPPKNAIGLSIQYNKILIFSCGFFCPLHFIFFVLSCPFAPISPLKIPLSPSPFLCPSLLPLCLYSLSPFRALPSCLDNIFIRPTLLHAPSVSFPVPVLLAHVPHVPFPVSYLPVQCSSYLSPVPLSTLSLGPLSLFPCPLIVSYPLSCGIPSCPLYPFLCTFLLPPGPFSCPPFLNSSSALPSCLLSLVLYPTALFPTLCPTLRSLVPYPVPYPSVPRPLHCALPSYSLSTFLCHTPSPQAPFLCLVS
jgi:hypothetical protein